MGTWAGFETNITMFPRFIDGATSVLLKEGYTDPEQRRGRHSAERRILPNCLVFTNDLTSFARDTLEARCTTRTDA